MYALVLWFCIASLLAASFAEINHIPKRFKYSYGVSDFHTGDHHGQSEDINGEEVEGTYYLKEPDGTTRIVTYVAGPHEGFKAAVRRNGIAKHPTHGHAEAKSFVQTRRRRSDY